MKVKHKHHPVKDSERQCNKCVHAHLIDTNPNTYECDAEVYDIRFLTCFVPRTDVTPVDAP